MRRLRVLALVYPDHVPPDSIEGLDQREVLPWRAEYDVISCLRTRKHEVLALGVQEELQPIRDAVEAMKPHVVFNLLEEFHHNALYDHNIVS
ncbi:MAG TPA: hypothetical protein VIC55_09795, partial [Gemmatimonadaceae bacterium]